LEVRLQGIRVWSPAFRRYDFVSQINRLKANLHTRFSKRRFLNLYRNLYFPFGLALSHIDREYGMSIAAQAPEQVADLFHQAVLFVEQLLALPGFFLVNDSGPGFDPVAFEVAAHVAGRDTHARVVAYAFHLPGVDERIDVNRPVLFGEPQGRRDALPVSLEGFQVQVFLPGK